MSKVTVNMLPNSQDFMWIFEASKKLDNSWIENFVLEFLKILILIKIWIRKK